MVNNNLLSIKKIFLDCAILICFYLSINLIKKFTTIYQRGFYCNDGNLSFPLSEESVTESYFRTIAAFFHCFVIAFCEYFRQSKNDQKITIWRFKVPTWCGEAYHTMASFGFGLLCATITVIALKSTGRLRPNFLAVCAPDIDCSLPENQHVYHVNFNCTNNLDHPQLLINVRLSFPSGHASFHMFCAIFFFVYIQKRMAGDISILLKSAVQFVIVIIAFCMGFSRVSDYHHHSTDVIVGFIIGATCAVCITLKMLWPPSSSAIPMTHCNGDFKSPQL